MVSRAAQRPVLRGTRPQATEIQNRYVRRRRTLRPGRSRPERHEYASGPEQTSSALDGLRTALAALALLVLIALFFSTRIPTGQPGSART
jgi:hypothetical protein